MTCFRESARQREPSRSDAECHEPLRAGGWVLLLASCVLTGVAHSDAAFATETLPGPLAAGWRGQPVCVKLHETTEVRVLRCTFPPGVGHERHFHPRHFGYALAGGTMEILDQNGTRRADITAGSYFASEGIDWHEVLNVGDTVVQYLMIEPL